MKAKTKAGKLFSLFILTFLISALGVNAIQIAIDCNGKTASPGIDTTAICDDANPQAVISFYFSNVQPGDNLDQYTVLLDYDNSLLGYSSTGLNTGIGRSEFTQSNGASAIGNGLPVDSNTIQVGAGISGDCAALGTCPSGEGDTLKIAFDCMDYGTVYCGGPSSSFTIVDTRDIATTKTWWADPDGESDKRLFEEATPVCDDDDGDGYGECPNCGIANGCTYDGDDCDDTDADVNPGATEVVDNGKDDNCDGNELCYLDADDDTYRPDDSSTVISTDLDCTDSGEAESSDPTGDCDDTDADVNPGETEIVADGIDQDCDGVDDCYEDSDGDTYGSTTVITGNDLDCSDAGESDVDTDCDDDDADKFPGNPEVCDNKDNDCDGNVDEDLIQNCGSGDCAGTQTCTAGVWGACSSQGNACGDQGIECLIDDTCNDAGVCVDNGFESDDTPCGDDSDTECDNPDSCLAGTCETNYEAAGTDCGVCAACNFYGNCNVYDNTQDADCAATECPDDCGLSPDDNPFTWDSADDVPNECVAIFTCSEYECSYSHQCSIDLCSAECAVENDCPEKCTATSHKLYLNVECTGCECEYSNYQCVVGKCGAECDENTDCSCEADGCIDADSDGNVDDYADYPDYGMCGTAGSEGCLCQTGTGTGEDCEPAVSIDDYRCQEICNNGVDDDDDTLVDCEDTDCIGQTGPGGETCCQIDNDCNGYDDECADGVCDANNECYQQYKPASTVCRDASDDCDAAETCTGSSAACPADIKQPDGTSCGDQDDTECDNPDSCLAGVCEDNYESEGTYCGDAGTECINQDTCDATGTCVDNGLVADDTPCGDDSDTECDNPDSCLAGVCEPNYEAAGYACGDQGIECLIDDTCNGAGICTDNGYEADGTDCDDEDACNVGETCQSGTCTGGSAPDCSTYGDQCNDASCDPAGAEGNCDTLTPVTDGTTCNDGLYCTVDDECTSGTCGGSARDCSDGVDCTVDSCNEGTDSCDNDPDDSLCDDGLWCDGQEFCHATLDCQDGTPPDIDDNVDCTDDSCDETNDVIVNTPNDANCDDGLYCNGAETCHATLDCQDGTPIDCSGLDDQCNDGYCNENNDQCEKDSTPYEGQVCDDNLYCTVDDECTLGICDGDSRDCSEEDDQCNDGVCDEDQDSCVKQPANEGEACDDNLYCTVDDECTLGICDGDARDCSDGIECTDDICNEAETKCENPNSAPGTQCGQERNCPDSACNIFIAEFYPADGHDTCDGQGNCDEYSCEMIDSYCTDDDDTDGINTLECGAECDEDSDCACEYDGCEGHDYYDYPDYGVCDNDCACDAGEGTGEPCEPVVTEDDPRCISVVKTPIDKGVSMFSLPLIPLNSDSATFNEINDNCALTQTDGIAYWDPTIPDDPVTRRYVYITANDPLYPGQGYFITVEDACSITTIGDPYDENDGIIGLLGSGEVKVGWNMIASTTDGANFNNIKGNCVVTSGPWGFDADSSQYVRTNILEAGKGYYIKTLNDCEIGSGVTAMAPITGAAAASGSEETTEDDPPMLPFEAEEEEEEDEEVRAVGMRISDVEVRVDGKRESVNDGDTIRREAEPGSSVEFDVEVENLFEEDIDLEDVEFTITIMDIDDGDDLEEDKEIGDIRSGRKKSKSVEFEIPLEVEEDEFDVLIEVLGEDEDRNDYEEEWTITLEVQKEKHNVEITKANLFPEQVTCGSTSKLDIKILNLGSSDEENLMCKIENEYLGIAFTDTFDLEEAPDNDATFTKTYTLAIPKSIGSQLYPVMIRVYDEDDFIMDSKQLDLNVNCPKEEKKETKETVKKTEEKAEEEIVEVIMTQPVQPQPQPIKKVCFLWWCWLV